MKNIWNLRKSTGPAAPTQRTVSDLATMTREVKARARALGADLVGITTLKPEHVYKGHEVPYRHAVSRIGDIASNLSEEIRRMGWPARAYGNPNSGDLLQIPIAIDCGFGELGKHGSLISRDHGSNFRLGCVVTDLPLAVEDAPVDIGVDDLCTKCTACVRACPVDAIHDQKQWVRGLEKWYVDFDKCIYYFCETSGCAICIEVCPWSEEGVGPWLSEKLLSKRAPR